MDPVDVAVVLGSQVESDGQPLPRLTTRLDRVVNFYQSGMCRMIIVSGARGQTGFNRAVVMGGYLLIGASSTRPSLWRAKA